MQVLIVSVYIQSWQKSREAISCPYLRIFLFFTFKLSNLFEKRFDLNIFPKLTKIIMAYLMQTTADIFVHKPVPQSALSQVKIEPLRSSGFINKFMGYLEARQVVNFVCCFLCTNQ
jgi:hypothetical protein